MIFQALSPWQAAHVVKRSPDAIRRAYRSGKLPARNLGTATRPQYVIDRDDLLRWHAANPPRATRRQPQEAPDVSESSRP